MEKQNRKPSSGYNGNKSSKNESKNKLDIVGIWRNFSFYGALIILIIIVLEKLGVIFNN